MSNKKIRQVHTKTPVHTVKAAFGYTIYSLMFAQNFPVRPQRNVTMKVC